jgi:ferredoxin-NADP reductase
MARTAVLARLTWRPATLVRVRTETDTAHTLTLELAGWTGHVPGQHVDLRLTAPDGYTAVRPYSIASLPAEGTLDLTVATTSGGEVSPYLVQTARPGVVVELRGPLGEWFVWRPEQVEPVQLIAGGTGLVPLMSMLRTHRAHGSRSEMRLLYSTRAPDSLLYAEELTPRRTNEVTVVYTRTGEPSDPRPAHRIDALDVATHAIAAAQQPLCYVCGPTDFVEAVIGLLLQAGHDPRRIRAERFGAGRN